MKHSLLLCSVIVLSCTVFAFAQTPAPTPAPAPAPEPSLFDEGQEWTFIPGAEFPPGGSGTFVSNKEEDQRVGILTYDFSKGGTYVAGQTSVDIAEGNSSFHFRAKSAQPIKLAVRLIDSTKQVHQTSLSYTDAGQWQSFRIDLKEKAVLHFGGAKDGVIHYPIQAIVFIVSKTDAPGEIHFSSAAFVK